MKITPSSTGPRSEAAGASNATGDRKTGAATASSTAAEQDSIKLSPLSTELAALEASLAKAKGGARAPVHHAASRSTRRRSSA